MTYLTNAVEAMLDEQRKIMIVGVAAPTIAPTEEPEDDDDWEYGSDHTGKRSCPCSDCRGDFSGASEDPDFGGR